MLDELHAFDGDEDTLSGTLTTVDEGLEDFNMVATSIPVIAFGRTIDNEADENVVAIALMLWPEVSQLFFR